MSPTIKMIALSVLLTVTLIGGVNWLVTGINSFKNDNEATNDLLQNQLNISAEISNIIYFIVFACNLLLIGWVGLCHKNLCKSNI